MEILDRPKAYAELAYEPQRCLNVAVCELALGTFCGPAFERAIREELVEHCGRGFYEVCDFGAIVDPVCPFDPVPLAREWKLVVRLEELEAQVKELLAKG